MFDPATCYDVAVLGGGLCGFAAARSLARAGARVALIERRPVLGWEVTSAFHAALGEPACATAQWLHEAMTAANGCRDGVLDPPIAEIVLDGEAAAAGIDLLLYAQPVAVAVSDGRLTGVLLGTKSGELSVRARAFVDATDNALVWRLAGADAQAPEQPAARLTLFLNRVPEAAVIEPLSLGDAAGVGTLNVHPTLWPGEVAVASVSASATSAWLAARCARSCAPCTRPFQPRQAPW